MIRITQASFPRHRFPAGATSVRPSLATQPKPADRLERRFGSSIEDVDAKAYLDHGNQAFFKGQPGTAYTYMMKAHKTVSEQNVPLRITILNCLGSLCGHMDRLGEGVIKLLDALTLHVENPTVMKPQDKVETLNRLGWLFLRAGNCNPRAEKHLAEAHAILNQHGYEQGYKEGESHPYWGEVNHGLGKVHMAAGKHLEAIGFLEEALSEARIHDEGTGTDLLSLHGELAKAFFHVSKSEPNPKDAAMKMAISVRHMQKAIAHGREDALRNPQSVFYRKIYEDLKDLCDLQDPENNPKVDQNRQDITALLLDMDIAANTEPESPGEEP